MKRSSVWLVGSSVAVLSVAGGALALRDQQPQPAPQPQPAGQGQPARAAQGQGQGQDLGTMLIQGLQGTQGCMLVDNGRFQSGKNAIFAWFENREAVLRWYHSEAHRTAMSMVFGPEAKPREHALQGVPDDYNGPILAIAAITYATPEQRQASGRLFTQISIELYAPLKGGLHIGGTLGPAGMKLPGGRDASGEYAVPPIAKPAGQ